MPGPGSGIPAAAAAFATSPSRPRREASEAIAKLVFSVMVSGPTVTVSGASWPSGVSAFKRLATETFPLGINEMRADDFDVYLGSGQKVDGAQLFTAPRVAVFQIAKRSNGPDGANRPPKSASRRHSPP